MRFKELFENCKKQLKDEIKGIWLEDKELWQDDGTLKSPVYENQLDRLLTSCFSGENILVEDMGEWESADAYPDNLISQKYWREWPSDRKEEASLIDSQIALGQKTYLPFKHQVKSWEKLLNEHKSICVTSGTGSGKTECFMVPLVKDLADTYNNNHINGNKPLHEPVQAIFLYPLNALMDDQRTRMSECIECSGQPLTFAVYNGNTPNDKDDDQRDAKAVMEDQRKHEVVLRSEIRNAHHPNILFTNPTMLEYLLLRSDDRDILKHSQGQLRWIVIDETHTFTGAGAAELALLIRRVIDAFGTSIENIRFATSSATVGQGGDTKLKKFISDITGKSIDEIEIVSGCRTLQTINGLSYPTLHNETFLTLNEMVPNTQGVESQLEALDNLCDEGLKVKLHIFAKALNRGLYIDLNKSDNCFRLIDEIPLDPDTGHYNDRVLEAQYCQHCGTIFASGILNGDTIAKDVVKTTSIFDNTDTNENQQDEDDDTSDNNNTDSNISPASNSEKDVILITLFDDKRTYADENMIRGDSDGNMMLDNNDSGVFVYAVNPDTCPVCGQPMNYSPIRSFHIAADKVARILAPKLLEQAQADSTTGLLSQGKQMISFADSRAKAAKPSLKQNKEIESKWVEWVVYQKLQEKDPDEIREIEEDLRTEEQRNKEHHSQRHDDNIKRLKEELRDARNHSLSWIKAVDALIDDLNFDYFAKQFAQNDDLDDNGVCKPEYKKRYALAALYEVFKSRPRKKLCAETMGQIKIVYPEIEQLRNEPENEVLPHSVKELNKIMTDSTKIISLNDWCDFLTLYLDHKVRTNQCLYFEESSNGWHDIDITACRNLRTQNGVRRTVQKDKSNKRFKELLSSLLGEKYTSLSNTKKDIVDAVLDSCWNTLHKANAHDSIIERGKMLIEGKWVDDALLENVDENNQGRMNLTRISFKLPEEGSVKKCPVTNRYFASYFKCCSPYEDNTYPYGTPLKDVDPIQLPMMNEPMLFIQSEHTAQLGRKLTKERIKDFKEHKINILACSTTMEMGIDLGSVELVEMTNIPPHPANYKQRAGRAGRRGQTRSACVTICGSDGVDARFFARSKENVTKRIDPPTVDLNSPQIVQRHVNSYLFLKWSGTVSLKDEVKDLFTNYHWNQDVNDHVDRTVAYYLDNNEDKRIRPNGQDGYVSYETQHNIDALWSGFVTFLQQTAPSDSGIQKGLSKLINNTILSGQPLNECINKTKEDIIKAWGELDRYFLALKESQRLAEEYFERIQNNNSDEIDNDTNDKRKKKLDNRRKAINYDFTSRLSENLLTYLSNHQFLPNANMPVNIIELKKSDANERFSRNNENPTYDLATALSQWAPGNYVTIKDTTYQIGGVLHDYQKSWVKIKKCALCGHTWTSQETTCPICGSQSLFVWPTNGCKELRLLEPLAFVPTTDRSRITDNVKNYTFAKAELIGASKMQHPSKGWFAHRLSDSSTETSQILIYNDGMGFGYRVCSKCGKTQLETTWAQNQNVTEMIDVFYNKKASPRANRPILYYHDDLPGCKEPCFFNPNSDILDNKVRRNLIIGGLIQTDYCEIKLYKGNNLQLSPFSGEQDKKILTTLGILFCSFMVEQGICERNDIDFIVIGQDRLCIYDKAKGGAGYSKQLKQKIIEAALDYSRNRLAHCTSMYQLLDTYTQRYAEGVDIVKTLEWLEEEHNHREDIPRTILDSYPEATASSFVEIEQIIKN